MILCIDIGNSNIVVGGYKNDELRFSTRLSTDRSLEAAQYALQINGILSLYHVDSETIEGIALSSVVPGLTTDIMAALKILSDIKPMMLTIDNSNIEVSIDNPRELGNDILATAIAVKHSYALPSVIIDMGTATTITAMDAQGTVQGVSILAGLYIALDALTGSTSQLKGIAIEPPRAAIGKNSAESMKSGALFGNAAMLDGMLTRFDKELGGVKSYVATGGASQLVVPHCEHNIEYVPSLLLDGLYEAYKLACK